MGVQQAEEIVRKLWENDALAWHAQWVPVFRRFAHDLIIDIDASPGKMVLDIGTGTGVAAFEAAKRVKPDGFVFGIDRSPAMLAVGKAACKAKGIRNLRFILMAAERLLFPNELFDAVTSNCGIPSISFRESTAEAFRVLRTGGTFAYNEWRLKDVPAHRMFSEILEKHRTKRPSRKLETQRIALARLERFGNREMNLEAQTQGLRMTGFRKITVKTRNYRVAMHSIEEYLNMRFRRAALRQELMELSVMRRKRMMADLRENLKMFVRGRRFVFDWKVDFVRAKRE